MPDEPTSPSGLTELVQEVLAEPVPYGTGSEPGSGTSFYLVCDYQPIPKATVIVRGRPDGTAVQIVGFVPEGSAEERERLQVLLEGSVTDRGTLDLTALERRRVRVCSETEAVQRLLEVRQLLGVRRANSARPLFH